MYQKDNAGGMAGAAAGLGIALGAVALGALLGRKNGPRHADDAPGYTSRSGTGNGAVVGRTVTIRKPRAELFAFWRDFTNLPKVMENVEKVTKSGSAQDRAVWTIKAPAGRTVDVETKVESEKQDEHIAWRSVEGSDIETEGRVSFEDAPGERGTRVTLLISYRPPGGAIGRTIASVFLREPEVQARHDLKRFKMLMETGEVSTSARTKDQTRAAKQENAR